ncbi:MAG: antibiotic biosynthesis monooxygenase [Rhodospirillaceae bacterium]|jgi:quinol monooxygenase YgiN|nr:antibiotic biosynthesis monooxygenase [Rhodospirillaceae bacterium]|tara:strand:- start:634 stop:915 length:282 start_codon:yes stop_codon:yes gene_type:complete
MYVVTVEFDVIKGKEAEFRAVALKQSVDSLEEDGCTCFDIGVSDEDPYKYIFYEVYHDRAAFEAHLKTPYLEAFRKKSAELTSSRRRMTWTTE